MNAAPRLATASMDFGSWLTFLGEKRRLREYEREPRMWDDAKLDAWFERQYSLPPHQRDPRFAIYDQSIEFANDDDDPEALERIARWPDHYREVAKLQGLPFPEQCVAGGAEAADAAGAGKAGELPLIWASTIQPRMEAGGTLVAGLLDAGGMSVIYAPSNAGKSFFCLDLAFHIAMGWDWRGRKVRQRGSVIYVAAEGGFGFYNRVAALRAHHGLGEGAEIPLALMPAPVDLLDPKADTQRVIAIAERVKRESGQPVLMIVIDTLSRAMAGGDENGPKDMTAFVRNVDRIRGTGAHCMIVHHAGKDTAKGARGHSSLRAATDTEIELIPSADGTECVAMVTKQRDLPGGDAFRFTLKSIELGLDEDGAPVSSAIVEHVASADEARKPVKLSAIEQAALAILVALADAEGVQVSGNLAPEGLRGVAMQRWREECDQQNLSDAQKPESRERAIRRAVDGLKSKGRIGTNDGQVWVAPIT